MPTIISHSIFGAGLAKFTRFGQFRKILVACILLAALPDSDALVRNWVSRDSMLAHRGITHSLFFATCIGILTASLFIKKSWVSRQGFWRLAVLFSAVIASHPILDAFTNGGNGVGFFLPFDSTRYFFPIRPIPVAPFAVGVLLTVRGARLFLAEACMVWTLSFGSILWNRKSPELWQKICAVALWVVGMAFWVAASLNADFW